MAVSLTEMTAIASFEEASEILRSKNVVQGNHIGRIGEPIVGHTLLTLHGEPHFERRRLENALFRHHLLAEYELSALRPALRNRINALRASAAGPHARVDLLALVRTVLQVIAANVIGLDGVDSDEAVERLRWYSEVFAAAASADFATEGQGAIIQRALEAKDQFVVEFLEPAKQRRLDRIRRGSDRDTDSPSADRPDLLTVFLTRSPSPSDEENELLIRETILYVIGSSATITQNCAHTVWLLLQWLDTHPADRALADDADFLRQAANESLRVYPPAIALLRRATDDFTLTSGRTIRRNEYLYIDIAAANRDHAVFGEDADEFNPHRPTPDGVRPFGLSFGGGPHMCIGRPLASGGLTQRSDAETEPIGVVPALLQELLAAQIDFDRGAPPRLQPNTLRHEFAAFPVTLAPAKLPAS